jgi:hypothetical protein
MHARRWFTISAGLCLAATLGGARVPAMAQPVQWQRFVIASTGASVDIPVTIFGEDAGAAPGGAGRRFERADRRADLTVQSIPNPGHETPAAFLARKNPPPGIVYKRITPDFFVVSSFKDQKIWYNRCNRAAGYMNCILINYPAAEKRDWDDVVTRISHSLAAGA